MIDLGKNHPEYCPSAILSKKIREFNDQVATLKPYLKGKYPNNFHEINTEHPQYHVVFDSLSQIIEPTVLHIRVGTNNDLREEMITKLVEKEYMNLEVNELIRYETERRTEIGQELLTIISAGKIIPSHLIVKILRKIIYSGNKNNKFILSSFPDIIEHVKSFE